MQVSATGYAIEFCGSVIDDLSVEARMTICNMAVEAGARGAFMSPDDKVFSYLKDTPRAPKGDMWTKAVDTWRQLRSDPDAKFDKEIYIDCSIVEPFVTWGISPDQAGPINGLVPDPEFISDEQKRKDYYTALKYMDLKPGTPFTEIKISHAFIGSGSL